MRSLVAAFVCTWGLLWIAPGAAAEDLPAFGPTSIAVPVGWKPGPARVVEAPQLVRAPRGGYVAPGAYDIRRDGFRPRGPVEVRDEWILAQPKLTLPAVSPDPLPCRSWMVKLHIDRGSDFGWNQIGPAQAPIDRRFLVDGEHQTTELSLRYGLLPRLAVGLRVPLQWRGSGFMDGPIDWFHELTEPIGFKDNGRPLFTNDTYRVNGRSDDGTPISWDGERGVGLGNIELEAYWYLQRPMRRSDWRAALIARAALPTGSDPYDTGGVDLGLQLVAAKQVAERFDLYGGVGGTWFSDTEHDGLEYEELRAHGFVAMEYHWDARHSIVVEVDAASRLVKNLASYPALSMYINVALKVDFSDRIEFEIGFTENLEDQQGTIDFGGFAGLTFRL